MADITVTAANVRPYGNAVLVQGKASTTITAGQSVYLDSAGLISLADNDALSSSQSVGIAVCGASRKQPVVYQTGGDLDLGATLVIGTTYVVSSTAGAIAPIADLATADYSFILGTASEVDRLVIAMAGIGEPVP